MAFDSLSERLQGTLKKVSGQGRLTEKNMEEMLSEIRLALLEADVNFQVVKEFIAATKEKPKINTQEFLDTFGKWLCKEPVEINGVLYRLNAYPELSEGRKITKLTRDNSYDLEPQDGGVQDWILPVSVEYKNEFERW